MIRKHTTQVALRGIVAILTVFLSACGGRTESSQTTTATASSLPPPALSTLQKQEPQGLFYAVEHVGSAVMPAASSTVTVPRGQDVVIDGWAVDPYQMAAAGGVIVTVDEKEYAAQIGTMRTDVTAALKSPACENSGFTVTVPSSALSPGQHRLAVHVVSADRKAVFTPHQLTLNIQ